MSQLDLVDAQLRNMLQMAVGSLFTKHFLLL